MNRTPLVRIALLTVGLSIATSLAAQPPADSKTSSLPAAAEVKQVYVGLYLNQVDSVSLKDSQITVDFFVWFRWTDPDLKPIETFDLVNGKIDVKEDVVEREVAGMKYASCRVLASIHETWDVRRFPLDRHEISIEIEDGDLDETRLRYIADSENSDMNPGCEVAGWVVGDLPAYVVSHRYNTNYGDISLPSGHSSSYSRLVFPVTLSRPGSQMFIKLFAGMFIAAIIAFHALLIQPTELDARFALTVGAMFAAVASEYIVASVLPDANYLTLADKLHILTFIFIFLTMAVSVASYKAAIYERPELCWWFDRGCFAGFIAIYMFLIFAAVSWNW